jgi:maltooligosyltrehalose trehalohydrolase
MLFQGQEFASSSPFLFFADHKRELAHAVRKGRAEFLSQFPSLAEEEMQRLLAPPDEPSTFLRCKLDLSERERHAEAHALHCDLLRMRRDDEAFRNHSQDRFAGAVLGPEAFLLRFFNEGAGDRLLLVNLGLDLHLHIVPEPLLAPPEHCSWRRIWSSEDPRYGGSGTGLVGNELGWRIPGHAAVVLAPQPMEAERSSPAQQSRRVRGLSPRKAPAK